MEEGEKPKQSHLFYMRNEIWQGKTKSESTADRYAGSSAQSDFT